MNLFSTIQILKNIYESPTITYGLSINGMKDKNAYFLKKLNRTINNNSDNPKMNLVLILLMILRRRYPEKRRMVRGISSFGDCENAIINIMFIADKTPMFLNLAGETR